VDDAAAGAVYIRDEKKDIDNTIGKTRNNIRRDRMFRELYPIRTLQRTAMSIIR
jgi:hypothetical protein